MKKRVLIILISVFVLSIGIFGVKSLLAHASKTQVASVAPKTETKQADKPSISENISTPVYTNTSPPKPPDNNDTKGNQSSTVYDAVSPAIISTSIEYMPSNYLDSNSNFNMESSFKKFVSEWTDETNFYSTAHKSDSLVNGEIFFQGYVDKNVFLYLHIKLKTPIDTISGKSEQVYDDTAQDLNSFANYLQKHLILDGFNISIEGNDGESITYESMQSYGFFQDVKKNTFLRQDLISMLRQKTNGSFSYPQFYYLWRTKEVKTDTPSNCPEIQSLLPIAGKKIYEALK